MLQEANLLSMEIGSLYGINRLRLLRGLNFLADGKVEQSRAELESYVDHCFQMGEKNSQSMGLLYLGLIEEIENDLEKAVERLQKALEIEREIRSPEIFRETKKLSCYLRLIFKKHTACLTQNSRYSISSHFCISYDF